MFFILKGKASCRHSVTQIKHFPKEMFVFTLFAKINLPQRNWQNFQHLRRDFAFCQFYLRCINCMWHATFIICCLQQKIPCCILGSCVLFMPRIGAHRQVTANVASYCCPAACCAGKWSGNWVCSCWLRLHFFFFFFFENILIGVRVVTLTKQKQLKFLRQIMQCNHIQLIVMLLKHIQNKLFYWQRQPLQGTKNERTPKII